MTLGNIKKKELQKSIASKLDELKKLANRAIRLKRISWVTTEEAGSWRTIAILEKASTLSSASSHKHGLEFNLSNHQKLHKSFKPRVSTLETRNFQKPAPPPLPPQATPTTPNCSRHLLS